MNQAEIRKIRDALLDKMQSVLEENILVVAEIQRQKYNSEMRAKNEDSVSVR